MSFLDNLSNWFGKAKSNLTGNISALTNPQTRSTWLSGLFSPISSGLQKPISNFRTNFDILTNPKVSEQARNNFSVGMQQPDVGSPSWMQPFRQFIANTALSQMQGVRNLREAGNKLQSPSFLDKLSGGLQTGAGVSNIVAPATPPGLAFNALTSFTPQLGKHDWFRRGAAGFYQGYTGTPNTALNVPDVKTNLPVLGKVDVVKGIGQMAGFTKNPFNEKVFGMVDALLPEAKAALPFKQWLVKTGIKGGIANLLQMLPDMSKNLSPDQKVAFIGKNFGVGSLMNIGGEAVMNTAGKGLEATGLKDTAGKIYDNLLELKRKASIPVYDWRTGETKPMWQHLLGNREGSIDTGEIQKTVGTDIQSGKEKINELLGRVKKYAEPGSPAVNTNKQNQFPDYLNTQSKNFGQSLRTFFTGRRDKRIVQTNQLRDELKKTLPDYQDQEALTLYREFKNKPKELQQFLNGTHPYYKTIQDNFKNENPSATKAQLQAVKQEALQRIQRLAPVIQRTLKPGINLVTADKTLSKFFNEKLVEGKKLGFLDSKINPDEYINHILLTGEEPPKPISNVRGGKIGRTFEFGKQRYYPTLLHAIANGKNPATLNALDAMTLYGSRHGTVAATKELLSTLKESGLGKFGTENSPNIPDGWVRVAPGNRLFENRFAMKDPKTGKPVPGSNFLMAPPKVAEALKPITDPSYLNSLPGFARGRMFQAYIKSIELGLSVFHMRALSLTATNNMGPEGMVKAFRQSMDSADFKNMEQLFVERGGTTSELGKTIEAYRGLKKSSLPQNQGVIGRTFDTLRNLPGIKQVDQLAKTMTDITFNQMQRKFKVADFALQRAQFIAKQPGASTNELSSAEQQIADEVNSAYGGLNWEDLGINRLTQDVARAFFLAPDWTYSNIRTAQLGLKGGPAGQAARAFWVRSAVTGLVLTQLTSLMLSGKASSDPTSVYLGKDKQGRDIYQNMYFVGAAGDAVNLLRNMGDYGVPMGAAQELAAKASPLARTGMQVLTNRNYYGQQIIPKGSGPVVGTIRGAGQLAANLGPVPFSVSGPLQMLTDKQGRYTPKEYATTFLTGARTRHVIPPGMRQVTSGASKGELVPSSPTAPNSLWQQIITGKMNQPKPSGGKALTADDITTLNNMNDELQQGTDVPAQIKGNTLYYIDDTKNKAVKEDLSSLVTSGRGVAGYQNTLKKYKAADKIYASSGISDATKQQAFQLLKLNPQDVAYDYQATATDNSAYQTQQLEAMQPDQMAAAIAQGRIKSLSGKYLISNTTIDNLYKDNYLSRSDAASLKKLSFEKKNGKIIPDSRMITSFARGSGTSSAKLLNERKAIIKEAGKPFKVPKTSFHLPSGKTAGLVSRSLKAPANPVKALTLADVTKLTQIRKAPIAKNLSKYTGTPTRRTAGHRMPAASTRKLKVRRIKNA